jgi:hypothetical protein
LIASPKDNPMQNYMIQTLHATNEATTMVSNKFCLYCGEQVYVVHECPKKCGQHITHAIFIAKP